MENSIKPNDLYMDERGNTYLIVSIHSTSRVSYIYNSNHEYPNGAYVHTFQKLIAEKQLFPATDAAMVLYGRKET